MSDLDYRLDNREFFGEKAKIETGPWGSGLFSGSSEFRVFYYRGGHWMDYFNLNISALILTEVVSIAYVNLMPANLLCFCREKTERICAFIKHDKGWHKYRVDSHGQALLVIKFWQLIQV